MNLPNMLTVMRVILIPIMVILYYLPIEHAHFYAAFIFTVACATDYLDGYLARRWKQMTSFGAFLDPAADKLIVAVALIMVVGDFNSYFVTIPALIIISREIIISSLREWMAELGKRNSVAVGKIGKWKTFLQMLGIGFWIWRPEAPYHYFLWLGYAVVYISVILTIWSMVIYLLAAWKDLMSAMKVSKNTNESM